MKRYTWFAVSMLMILPIIVVAYSLEEPQAVSASFRFAINGPPNTLDPALITGEREMIIAGALFEGLTAYNPQTLEPLPAVAQQWKIEDNTYVFFLRECKWSDGSAVTAQDFIYSWQRALTPKTGSKYADQLFHIKNARQFYEGTIKDFAQVGVSSPKERILKVELEHPVPYFLQLTSFVIYMPVKKQCVEKYGDKWTRPGNIVSNGTFKLDSSGGNEISLVKNEKHWAALNVKLQDISIKIVPSDNTAVMMFENDELDWVNTIPYSQIKQLSSRQDFVFGRGFNVRFIRFNTAKPPFNDQRVRKAFYTAVEKSKVCMYGGEVPAKSFVPDGIRGYSPLNGLPYNAEMAAGLLAEAGFPAGRDFPEVELLYQSSENARIIAETLQLQWKKVLGVKVTLCNVERGTYFSRRKSLDYQMCLSDWRGDYLDPQTFLEIFTSKSGNNQTGWSNAGYDELIVKGAASEGEERERWFRQAEQFLVDTETPVIPLYFGINRCLLKEGIQGYYNNMLDIHPLWALRWPDPDKK